ncbi:hypothetical protein PoB_007065200 [Plakobranchus ocellatus]|uniref:Uncharacterized protein n=1 Tax=Plakobranchus ocellatus TaxID=259542 RepID=A0AAV4DIR0_9GAST|nr:hypothetical protein PoB_007065200 [Plakobranchus ocellatus]
MFGLVKSVGFEPATKAYRKSSLLRPNTSYDDDDDDDEYDDDDDDDDEDTDIIIEKIPCLVLKIYPIFVFKFDVSC